VVKGHPHSIGGVIDSQLIDVILEFDSCGYIDPGLDDGAILLLFYLSTQECENSAGTRILRTR